MFDIVLTVFFSVEMLVKMIASGVYASEKAYLTNNFNVLDFLVVVASIISLSLSSFDLSFLKAFRVLRALRPLRMVSRLPGLKAVVHACTLVIQPLANFTMVVSVFIFTFAILGASIFRGKLSYCHAEVLHEDVLMCEEAGQSTEEDRGEEGGQRRCSLPCAVWCDAIICCCC